MRIDNNNMAGIGASGLNRAQAAEAAERQANAVGANKTSSSSSDRVNLSTLAEQIKKMDVNSPQQEQRLSQLAAVFKAGKYAPDPEAISGAMLDEALGGSSLAKG